MNDRQPQPTPADPPLAKGDALQALLSAGVFGTLGALAGNFLGSKGGEHGPRMFGKKFFTWMGGLMAGAIALYVSLKNTAATRIQTEPEATLKPLMDVADRPAARPPEASRHAVVDAAHDGMLQSAGVEQVRPR